MASKLGNLIRKTRLAQSVGLRELARRIGKSPAYLVSLERAEELPGASEDTLKNIASELGLELDVLLALSEKTPHLLIPRSPTQVALYRLIKELPVARQEEVRKQLDAEVQSQKVRTRISKDTSEER